MIKYNICPKCVGRLISYSRQNGPSYASCASCDHSYEWETVRDYWNKKEKERIAKDCGSYEI